ncbi:hypothetical protein EON65_02915 [archaeon]|nr:MAG: hypothetical protein EON65_02915 [archaeon]
MQALLQRQQENERLRTLLNADLKEKTVEERVDHCKELQYVQHQQLFAVSYTSLHKSAAENSLVGVKFFLNRCSKNYTPVGELDKHGLTALHCAAEKGCNDVIRFLVEEGCDVDVRSAYDNTPLMYACKENRESTIELLLELGAKPTCQNKAGMNCMHFAAQSNHVAALIAVASHYSVDKKARLLTLSEKMSNDSMITGHSLDYEFVPVHHPQFHFLSSLNQPSNTKLTPLHLAVISNSVSAVETLLSLGSNVNAQDNNRDTPLHKVHSILTFILLYLLQYTILTINVMSYFCLYTFLMLSGIAGWLRGLSSYI